MRTYALTVFHNEFYFDETILFGTTYLNIYLSFESYQKQKLDRNWQEQCTLAISICRHTVYTV